MREILFRGKRVDNGAWETGSLVILWQGTSREQVYIADKVTGYHTPVDPSTVGQYTGLTDRNSKKVFEGDILDFDYDTSPVRMSDYCWCLDDGVTLICELNNVEVIGNIHDNPDLLK